MTTPDQPTAADIAAMPAAELLRLAAQAAREDLDDIREVDLMPAATVRPSLRERPDG